MTPSHVSPKNLAVFASGRGSNFEAILKAISNRQLDAKVVCVISNRAEAGALETARQNQIPAYHISQKNFPDEYSFANALLEKLAVHRTDLIVLAGYLKIIPDILLTKYPQRIVNIHPALLPSFGGQGMYGLKVHQAVLNYGAKVTGVTVHLVDQEYDHGPVLIQRALEVFDDDTPEALAHRVLEVEHQVYPEALQLLIEKKIMIDGRRVKFI